MSSVRQRGGQKDKKGASPMPEKISNGNINGVLKDTSNTLQSTVTSEWDYKAALAVITVLAFITRFWGIGHPNEVVFDEVHFGKVRNAGAPPLRRARTCSTMVPICNQRVRC